MRAEKSLMRNGQVSNVRQHGVTLRSPLKTVCVMVAVFALLRFITPISGIVDYCHAVRYNSAICRTTFARDDYSNVNDRTHANELQYIIVSRQLSNPWSTQLGAL